VKQATETGAGKIEVKSKSIMLANVLFPLSSPAIPDWIMN